MPTRNGIVLPYCPALHMPDDDTFLENLPTVVDWVASLRAATLKAKVRVDPITFNSPYPRPGDDPRNRGLYGAAWCLRLLYFLNQAGVTKPPSPWDPDMPARCSNT